MTVAATSISACHVDPSMDPKFGVEESTQTAESGSKNSEQGSGSQGQSNQDSTENGGKSNSDGSSQSGANRIESAGHFNLPVPLLQPNGAIRTKNKIPVSPGVTASCTIQNWTEREIRELTNRVGLNLSGSKIYPGALLQGKNFEEGMYSPITIPRSPGTIYLTGVNLDKGASYHAKDIEMTGSGVNEALQRLITEHDVQGTSARSSYEEHVTHSAEEMLFRIGVDGRFGAFDMKANLSVGNKETRNYAFVKFTQVFYDVNFEDPELNVSVFKDEGLFKDPELQISAGNPPLYVSKVSYGRMVFFVAESTHDALEVKSALGAAVRGGPGSVKADSGLSFEEILSRSRIYYYVIGGAADLALAPIKAASDQEMFSAVKNFIGDRQSANFSAENPGAPIAYTLNYLSDRTPAKMAYEVNYDRRDCTFFHDKSGDPGSKNIQVDLSNTQYLVVPDKVPGSGDTEFFGNGPEVEIHGKHVIVDDRLEFRLSMTAKETGGDKTHFHGEISEVLYQAPQGWKIKSIQSPSEQRYKYIDKDLSLDVQEFGESTLFKKLEIVGNSFGDDLGKTKTTAILNPLQVTIEEK